MDIIEQSEIEYTLQKINYIMQSMNNDDQLSVLNETDLLLKFLEKKKNAFLSLEKEISSILLDKDKMRIVKLLKKVKEESDSGVEYYDEERGNDSKLTFNEEYEKTMNILNDKIRSLLAEIIKEKIGETKI
jgi:hypothetical protein